VSELGVFRDHCLAMAAMTEPKTRERSEVRSDGHGGVWIQRETIVVVPLPTATERGLWKQLAGEIDTYLDATADVIDDHEETLL
jgi:hypothetical protein